MKPVNKMPMLLVVSILALSILACNLPYGIGLSKSGDGDKLAQGPETTPAPTNTATATRMPTFTPTSTPQPTATATRVVQPTATPTAVSGATGVSAEMGGDPTQIAQAATATAEEAPATPTPRPPVAGTAEVIANGDFEEAWPDWQPVANGWVAFDNGQAHIGWYKDTWTKVVFDGKQAQLIEIISDQRVGDRYAGIYQTVDVVAGAEYTLVIHGLVRSDEGSEGLSGGGYALQYGLDYAGGADWQTITDWVTLPFPEHPRQDPNADNVYNYGTHTVTIWPGGTKLTLFIRAWKKWPDTFEGNFDVDGVSLRGTGAYPTATFTPTPTVEQPTPAPSATATPTVAPEMPASGGEIDANQPSRAIYVITILSLLVLAAGAVWGVIKRNV